MGVLSGIAKLVVYSLALVGLVTVAFVVFAYGWDGEPPAVGLEQDQ